MFYFLIALLGILLTIFFVVGTHEAAHYIAARLLGVKVLRFSIGFGKRLFHYYDKKGTEYVFALIPLGGYVKMLDEGEGDVPPNELHLAFNRQPFYKKFLIVIAGPAINIACAVMLYWLIFMIGFVNIKPVIGNITAQSIAAEAGLQSNQEIIRIDNHVTRTWTSIIFRIIAHAGNQDQLQIEVKNLVDQKTSLHKLDLSNWHMEGLTPNPLASLGITPFAPKIPLIIGVISPNAPAAQSKLQVGDKIIALNAIQIKNWEQLITFIHQHPNETFTFTIERKGKSIKLPVTIGYQRNFLFQKDGYLGISPSVSWPKEFLTTIQYGPAQAMRYALIEVMDFTYFNFLLFGKLITGKISLQSLGGPITIFESAGEALNYGFLPFIGFLAFLSIAIGIINILPIPGLDGGHLLIQIIELIIRRPVPEKIIFFLYQLGFLLIFFIFFQAFINDILRLSF